MAQVLASDEASTPIPWPPLSGSGSDREAWVAFARKVAQGNEEAWQVVDEQAALIASLEAEVAQLRAQLAEPEPAEHEPTELTPKSRRRKTSEDTRAAIRADLATGLSQSQATVRNGVSAMTVSRLVRSA